MIELKPCPFCGGNPHITLHSITFDGSKLNSVHCNECPASMLGVDNEPVDKWNKRENK